MSTLYSLLKPSDLDSHILLESKHSSAMADIFFHAYL